MSVQPTEGLAPPGAEATVWPADFDPARSPPDDPDPWTALYVDQGLWIDPEAKAALVRNMRSWSRRAVLPILRPVARTFVVVNTLIRLALPSTLARPVLLHRILVWGLRNFVRRDANFLVLRHFHLGSEILAFIAANVPGFKPTTRPLRPSNVGQLMPDVFLRHDINIYRFILELNAYLAATGRELTPPERLDLSSITDGPMPIDAALDGTDNGIDVHSAVEAYTPIYQLLLSDRDFWRASNSLQLDEIIGVYVARILGNPYNLAFMLNRHPLIPQSTLKAGFRLMLHGLVTEQLHGYLRQLKRAQATGAAIAGTRTTMDG
ncbi:DUF6999 family protein [Inquilinus limosus]|uniref:DUF6999 family protein n=1 Tax=Inquilinus limosus TaxID=171674 RepID=UPI000A930353|nr:hypothetical protein [Inquilinus limosus]